jgi:DNA replication licensing factor MCM4
MGMGNEMSSNNQVLWGTNIQANEVQMKLKEFINTFVEINDDDEEDEAQFTRRPYYIEKLIEVKQLELNILEVNCDHIYQMNPHLYRQIEDYPTDLIPIFDLVVSQVYKELDLYMGAGEANVQNQDGMDDEADEVFIQVRPFNLRKIYRIRELDPSQIDKMVTLRGIIIRNGDVVPEMKQAAFKCMNCNAEELRYIERGKVIEPMACNSC